MVDDPDDAPARLEHRLDHRLDHRVAEAAEAWLTDPRDTGVYARLVAAITERRTALDAATRPADPGDEPRPTPGPGLPDGDPDTGSPVLRDDAAAADADADADAADDADTADAGPVAPLRPVGADLLGDPRAVLDRLRRG